MGSDAFTTLQLVMVDVIGPVIGVTLILFVIAVALTAVTQFLINILSS